MWSWSFVIKSNFLLAYRWILGFKRKVLRSHFRAKLSLAPKKETYTLYLNFFFSFYFFNFLFFAPDKSKQLQPQYLDLADGGRGRELTDSENSHIVSLLSSHILRQMRHYTLTKAIGSGPPIAEDAAIWSLFIIIVFMDLMLGDR